MSCLGLLTYIFVVDVMNNLVVLRTQSSTSTEEVVGIPINGGVVGHSAEPFSEDEGTVDVTVLFVEQRGVDVRSNILQHALLSTELGVRAEGNGGNEEQQALTESLVGNGIFALHGCCVRCIEAWRGMESCVIQLYVNKTEW